MSTSPTSTWCCPTTPPVSTAARMTSPRKRRPHGKPPCAGTTSTQSSGLPKFERSEQRRARFSSPGRTAHRESGVLCEIKRFHRLGQARRHEHRHELARKVAPLDRDLTKPVAFE